MISMFIKFIKFNFLFSSIIIIITTTIFKQIIFKQVILLLVIFNKNKLTNCLYFSKEIIFFKLNFTLYSLLTINASFIKSLFVNLSYYRQHVTKKLRFIIILGILVLGFHPR